MNVLLVDYLCENKNILLDVFAPGKQGALTGMSCDFLPAFLENIELEIDDETETVALLRELSLKSLALALPLVSKEKKKLYGFIRIHLEKLSRGIYEKESKKRKWKQCWVRVENCTQDSHKEYDEAVDRLKHDYEKHMSLLREDLKLGLKKRTKKGSEKKVAEFENEAQLLAQEFYGRSEKAKELLKFSKIFKMRISPFDDVDLHKEVERVLFSYATRDLKSEELLKRYFNGKDVKKSREDITKIIREILVREDVITSQGLPNTKKISSLDDLKEYLSCKLGKASWENCSYCGTPFYKKNERGKAKRKYCNKPSCRTLAYRKRKRENV